MSKMIKNTQSEAWGPIQSHTSPVDPTQNRDFKLYIKRFWPRFPRFFATLEIFKNLKKFHAIFENRYQILSNP